MTGGLVAVHAAGRDRESIWSALERREVYGTTGQRTLLWFDLVNPPGSRGELLPMGSETQMDEAPIFSVRAVGSFVQKPGCPPDAGEALGPERLERLCKGECYHPGDARRPITRIEIVRIVPQAAPERRSRAPDRRSLARLRVRARPAGLREDVPRSRVPRPRTRRALLRARVRGARARDQCRQSALRARRRGQLHEGEPVPGPDGDADDCLAPREPRAWSSPIYVDFDRRR